MENLASLETLCETLYKSQDSGERTYLENTLGCFSQDSNYIPQLDHVLENARNPYAVLYASSTLLKHVTETSLPLQLRIQIRNHVINILATRGTELEPFVSTSLIQLLCRVTKISWFDDDIFRELVKDFMSFWNQEVKHYAIGLKVLNHLVIEMNQRTPELSSVENRKLATVFKDQALLQIYEISLTSLHGLKNDGQLKLQESALSLSLQCLSFDFAGMSPDETSDDVGAIQIPESWRSTVEEPSTVHIYFEYYAVTSPPLSKLALECLVRLTSVRRMLFTSDATRMKFLTSLMMGTMVILETGRGLNDHDNYHEFCHLLSRFKANYQLSEMMSVEDYSRWIALVSELTLNSLQSWQWASSSVYYLLGLWSRMVSNIRYLKGDFPGTDHLDEFVPMILEGFVSARFNSSQNGISDELLEDPLDKIELVQEQLDFFPHLCRFQYERCSTFLISILDPVLQSYMEGAAYQDPVIAGNLGATETQLALMVHVVGSIMRVKESPRGQSNERIDAELCARIFQLLNVMDTGSHVQRYGEISRQRLELSVLSFFQFFRRIYIGEHIMLSAERFYLRLSELLGLHDDRMVLSVMVRKIGTNLKCYLECEEVLDQTLILFLDLASGYITSKRLLKLDAVQYITTNHSKEHFRFLENYNSRRRTTFYYTVGSLAAMDNDTIELRQLMGPLLQVFVDLESTPDSVFRHDSVKCALVALMRDLRGVATAMNSRRMYGLFFDCLYPAHLPLLLRATIAWADTPEVMNPLLKFVAELVLNRSHRLMFEHSSVNGILLFREASRVLVAYGSRVLTNPVQNDVYTAKYKGMWISLTVLSRAMSGDYVNFGVFELYGDRAFADALDITLKMIQSIPAAHILAYRKLAEAYFSFMDIAFGKYIRFALDLDASTFEYIIRSLLTGLKDLNSSIVSKCGAATDHLASFYFHHIMMGESIRSPAMLSFGQHVSNCANIFQEILKTLFEIILFEDKGDYWNLGKPILSLILLSDDMYTNLRTQIVNSQPLDKRHRLLVHFEALMGNISRNLELRNREKFTTNLRRFKKEFRGK